MFYIPGETDGGQRSLYQQWGAMFIRHLRVLHNILWLTCWEAIQLETRTPWNVFLLLAIIQALNSHLITCRNNPGS